MDVADVHVLLDGQRRIEPEWRGSTALFRVPVPVWEVRLRSRVQRPRDLGLNDDSRLLGVAVRRLELGGAAGTDVREPEALRSLPGFHDWSPGALLWTSGTVVLPRAWFAGTGEPLSLAVDVWTLPAYVDDAVTTANDAALFPAFESLGELCDLAIVQAHHGFKLASLFQWGRTALEQVMAGLANGFAGIGDPAEVALTRLPGQDHKLVDPRYVRAHTWMREDFATPEALEEARLAGAARLRLLGRKFVEDLRTARRIYVFRPTGRVIDEARLRALHAALRRHGPARLLCVNERTDLGAPWGVSAAGDGLFIGYLDRPTAAPGAIPAWRALLEETHRLAGVAGG